MDALGKECIALLDLINFCLEAEGRDADVSALVSRLERVVPFESAILGMGETTMSGGTVTRKLYSHRCEAWLGAYQHNNLAEVDPIVARALRDPKPFRWGNAFLDNGSHDRKYLEVKSGIGLEDGIACAYRAPHGRPQLTLISLALRTRDIEQRHLTAVEYLLPHIHAMLVRDMTASAAVQPPITIGLTRREVEVLNWVKDGKCTWDIGMLLQVSERTVKFHLANIFSKLEVSTRAQALARAIQLGLIKL